MLYLNIVDKWFITFLLFFSTKFVLVLSSNLKVCTLVCNKIVNVLVAGNL